MLKDNPEELGNYYLQSNHKFSKKEQQKIERAFQDFDFEVFQRNLIDTLKRYYHEYEKTIEAGFNTFSMDKVIQMILFFTQDGLNKTVLLKHLFYADFLNFKRSLLSISGLTYIKYKHGPVPMKYNLLLDTLQETGHIEIEEEYFEEYTRTTIKSKKEFDSNFFELHELNVLNEVQEFFDGYGSKRISDFSHDEDGWNHTEVNKIIPYDFAENLKLD
ncbi:Panacea domain-containing protein [Bacillus sp. DJP31]|uniref:Panacea domain-containing protein n=1 Tax=Bacillus sp. DJP31 TaxID=3409789 RepID=UPI003BB48F86